MPTDPMHIYNVRARLAVNQVERDMHRALAREIDGKPRTIMTALREALEQKGEQA